MYTIQKLKELLSLAVLTAAILLTGCTTTHLEFDRMVGTAFPTEQTLNGESSSLTSIYAGAGQLLSVEEDDTAIQPLRSGGVAQQCISDAELATVEIANRDSNVAPTSSACSFWIFSGTCTTYEAYGIVVDHQGQCGLSCTPNLLGCMYDTTNRGGFAVYYQNSTISSDGQKFLRTTAHELGHAFNLHHGDGSGSETLMNTTGTVGNTFTYTFSAASQGHLDNHDAVCRYPGTGAWASVNAAHATRHLGPASCP